MNSSNDNEGVGILNSGNSRFGFYSAIFTAVITMITFGFAITAIPISGENCVEGCVKYPGFAKEVQNNPNKSGWRFVN